MRKTVFWSAGIIAVLLAVVVAGYFIAGRMIHRKVDAAIAALPPAVQVSYASFHCSLLGGTMDLDGVKVRYTREQRVYTATLEHVALDGIHYLELARTKNLNLRRLRLEGIAASEEKMHLTFAGSVELDSVYGPEDGAKGFGEMHISGVRLKARIPETDETIDLSHLELDSRKKLFRVDTLRILPVIDKLKIGEKQGHQVDIWEVRSEGIRVDGLDISGLSRERIVADRMNIRQNHIYVFRDRRLPLEEGEKPLPGASLRALPVSLRIKLVVLGPTLFTYEEYPKQGDTTGVLTIHRFSGSLEPLINKPAEGDPPYLTLRTKGSLMNSGTVEATTRIPLHAGDAYRVDGAFHELDVTKLNNPAEHLGHLHLESGILNRLDFHFTMSSERSTGEVTGQYHQLVVQKLRNNGKLDKLKSFALKQLIIPQNKESARGKVNYKRDHGRYFSFYLLHSLLVGVKSSFSLGFLLPG
jgi:hypothetical protein